MSELFHQNYSPVAGSVLLSALVASFTAVRAQLADKPVCEQCKIAHKLIGELDEKIKGLERYITELEHPFPFFGLARE